MARRPKLKLFRTAIGFHDAFVAAPSRAAALRAWGSDKDLFARGVAEEVDPAEMPDALETPGAVLRRSRGTTAEQVAALPPDRPNKPPKVEPQVTKPQIGKPDPKPRPPRPSRTDLEAAERALRSAREIHAREQADLRAEEQALARRRHTLARTQEAEENRLERSRAEAERRYRDALESWHREVD